MNGIPAKKIKSRPQNWISLIKFVENRQKSEVRLPYCNLYAYAANNPVHYIDPTGRSNSLVADYRNELIEGIKNLKKNIDALDTVCLYGNRYIPSNLKSIAKEDLGYNLDDLEQFRDFKDAISKLNYAIKRLDISNFNDGETKRVIEAFVDPFDRSHKIYITQFFKLVFIGLTIETTESSIFHEMTHFIDTLHTVDNYKLNRYELKKLPDKEKKITAQNWQLFYEDLFKEL